MLKLAYSFFTGILLAIFVGMGIATFYPQPVSPEYPSQLNMIGKDGPNQAERAVQAKFDAEQKAWEEKMKPYNRNVSMIAIGAAVAYVAISLLIAETRWGFLSDGIMLGGIFTLIYGLGRGFAAQNSKYSFAITTVGLVIVFLLGYLRFFKEHQLAMAHAQAVPARKTTKKAN